MDAVDGCARVLGPEAIGLALMVLSPRHQSLPERIAGIVWVIDD
jgi:hypothetical protein